MVTLEYLTGTHFSESAARRADPPFLLVCKWKGAFHGVFDSFIRADRFGGGGMLTSFVIWREPGNTAPFRCPGRKLEHMHPGAARAEDHGRPIRTAHAAGSFRSQRTFPLSGGKVCARSSGKGAVRPVLRTKKESSHGKFRSEVCVRCLNHITVREPPFTGRAEAAEGGKSLIVFNIGRIKVD